MGKAHPRVVTNEPLEPVRPRTAILDSGALIAFERGDARMRALLRQALETDARLVIPAGVLAQVWRNPAKQVALGALSRGPTTTVVPRDRMLAEAVGVLCGKRKTSDLVDASVVLTGRREGGAIITSDVDDLRHLDKSIELHRI
jgi:predicted nucleic acid-binding protein